MFMLIVETFVLLLGSALIGAALGHLLFEAFGARLALTEPDEPWLRDHGYLPSLPTLPAPPTLLDAAERARLQAAAAAIAPVVVDRTAAADAAGTRPAGLAAAEAGAPDDLERVKGIGPQNAARLHDLGVFHFAQIAAWSHENIAWVGTFLAFPGRIEREDWVGQAKAFLAEKA